MSDSTLEITVDASAFTDAIKVMLKVAPGYVYDAALKAGGKVRKEAIENTKNRLRKRTGNLLGGYVRRMNVSGVGKNTVIKAEVSGGNNNAQHFHLLENGHLKPGGDFKEGYHMMKDVKKNWENGQKFALEIDKALKKAIKDGFEINA